MKNTLLGLLFASLTAITSAQTNEDLISQTILKENNTKGLNLEYLQQVNQSANARIVKDLEVLAANYDITKDLVYQKGMKTLYKVRLGNGKNQINAVYDHTGVLIKAEEKYVDIVLPLSLRIAIAKKYPGWVFTKSSYKLNYSLNKKVERYCSLTLKKGEKKMRIQLPLANSDSLADQTKMVYGI